MPELEHALRGLGAAIEFPAEPDLTVGVRRRLREAPGRGWAPPRLVAVGLAVLAVAVGAVLAVPPARTALFEWFGIEGVKVTRVDELPRVRPERELALGERISLAEARRATHWLLEPHVPELGPPDAVYIDRRATDDVVSFLWGTEDAVELLLMQSVGEPYAEKLLAQETETERVDVNGWIGVWFTGEEHVFLYVDPAGRTREENARLVRRSLLWQQGIVTLRLEGDLTKEQALRIARSVDLRP